MKKILFATTALVATTGMAAADVSFGGYARYGVDYDEARGPTEETRIESRFRLIITASAESDNGLSFGAQTRLQMDDGASTYTGEGFNQPRFWVSTGGLEVSLGHVQGALEFMPGMYTGSVGMSGIGYGNVVYNYAADAYTSGAQGRQGFDIKYSMGDFSAHLSHSLEQNTYGFNGPNDRTALFLAYSFGDYNAAIAFQDSQNVGDTEWALTAGGAFGPANVTLQIADNGSNTPADSMKYGIGASYDVGAATTIAGYINHDEALPGGGDENMGIGVTHDLGGGASIRAGVADLGGRTRADAGVKFSF